MSVLLSYHIITIKTIELLASHSGHFNNRCNTTSVVKSYSETNVMNCSHMVYKSFSGSVIWKEPIAILFVARQSSIVGKLEVEVPPIGLLIMLDEVCFLVEGNATIRTFIPKVVIILMFAGDLFGARYEAANVTLVEGPNGPIGNSRGDDREGLKRNS